MALVCLFPSSWVGNPQSNSSEMGLLRGDPSGEFFLHKQSDVVTDGVGKFLWKWVLNKRVNSCPFLPLPGIHVNVFSFSSTFCNEMLYHEAPYQMLALPLGISKLLKL